MCWHGDEEDEDSAEVKGLFHFSFPVDLPILNPGEFS